MSEERVVGSKQRYRSREEVARVVADFEASGLTLREFSHRHGIPVGTLNGYRKRQRVGELETNKGEGLLRVEVSSADKVRADVSEAASLAVVLSGGRRIEVGTGFDATTLGRLLSVLEKA